jgi:predicted RNase H-like nuclease (RuvC/YqgF family)
MFDEIVEINNKVSSLITRIKNQQINNCPICMINNKQLDLYLFFNVVDVENFNNKLIEMGSMFTFSEYEIKSHKKHIYIEDLPKEFEVIEKESDDVKVIDKRILKIQEELKKLEEVNDHTSPQINQAKNKLNELLDLKRKFLQGSQLSGEGTQVDLHELVNLIVKKE